MEGKKCSSWEYCGSLPPLFVALAAASPGNKTSVATAAGVAAGLAAGEGGAAGAVSALLDVAPELVRLQLRLLAADGSNSTALHAAASLPYAAGATALLSAAAANSLGPEWAQQVNAPVVPTTTWISRDVSLRDYLWLREMQRA